jgi:hypothetical protein
MTREETITLKLLSGEWRICPRCKGLGPRFIYYNGIVEGCRLCESFAIKGYVRSDEYYFADADNDPRRI